MDIDKNAESIFYARNENNELFGIDKARSGSISVFFEEGGISQFIRYKQPDAVTTPESQFPENARILRGFVWRDDERPKSVEDLFSDDPPLELPIIKGLDDYVPQEEFFDDAMLERIDKADEDKNKKLKTPSKTPNQKSKVSRNLPQEVLDKKAAKAKMSKKPMLKSKDE